MPKPTDYTGQRFGRLVATRFTGKHHTYAGHKKRIWEFKCDCGVVCEKVMEKVMRGWTKSCGCLKLEKMHYFGSEATAYQIYREGYADGDLTFEEWYKLSQQPCYFCGTPPMRTRFIKGKNPFVFNGVDRLHNRKHDKNDCVSCCWRCNEMKKAMPIEEFLQLIELIYQRLIANKTT